MAFAFGRGERNVDFAGVRKSFARLNPDFSCHSVYVLEHLRLEMTVYKTSKWT